jgi:hypothetical protein
MDDFFLELDGNRDVRLRFTPEVAGDELRLTMAGGVAAGVFAEQALVTWSAADIPTDEREVLAARVTLSASPAIALLRFIPRDGAVTFTAPGGENPFAFYGESLRGAIDNPHARFPLVLVAKVTIPANPGTPEPFRALYYLVRYEASHAARAEAHDAFDVKGERFGWDDWKSWSADLNAADWGAMSDPERLLAIASARILADERDAATLTPHFAGFSERAPDADGSDCTYCGTPATTLYRVSAAEPDDAVTAGAREHGRSARLMCEKCLATNQGRQLDEGRREALDKLRAIWGAGRLASGSFSGDLHALVVIIGGKDGYFTIAERQAKELVDLLTGGQVTDLTAEKSVSEHGADALFFANRGLFSASDRAYIAVEVKTTSSTETLVGQIDDLIDVVRNAAAKALFRKEAGEGRNGYDYLTPAQQAVIDAPGALKRWYRFYVAQFVYKRLAKSRSLPPTLVAARDRLAPLFGEAPEQAAEQAAYYDATARALEPLVESVLVARFTSLDGRRDTTGLERIITSGPEADPKVTEPLATAMGLAQSYFDSYLCFDLFGEPIAGLCASSLPQVDAGSAERALASATRLLTRLRVYRHARNHPAHYPREAVARLTAEAAAVAA